MDKLKILVAEDDKTTQKLYDGFLSDGIFDKRLINNGEEALELYRSWQPNIIILDIMLPVFSGYSLLKKIREEMEDKLTPIIISSSLSSKEDVIDCMKLGIQGYLAKPINWKGLSLYVLACYEKVYPAKSDFIADLKKKLEEGKARSCKDTTPKQKP